MNFNTLIIMTNMPSPYQVELFNTIGEDIELKVIYAKRTIKGRQWNFEKYIRHNHIFLKGGLRKRLLQLREIINSANLKTFFIISGYNVPEFVYAMKLLNSKKIPWAFWGEKIKLKKLLLKKLTVLSLVKNARCILSMGEQAASIYYEILKMPVYNFPYHIDTEKFPESDYFHGGKINFMYSGQIIERKGVHTIKNAILGLESNYIRQSVFHFIGEGPMLSSLKTELGRLKNVKFYGFIPYENLPSLYKIGDVFLFPSLYDGWGVALIEGMTAGMVPISTFSTGAAVQNILHGFNGYLIPPDNPQKLMSTMKYIIDNKNLVPIMGKRAREYVTKHNDVKKGKKVLLDILKTL